MKLSVIIPTYNRREILEKNLRVLERQNCDDFEVIVVDDGSTDGTAEMLEGFDTSMDLKFFVQKNMKQGEARNHGVREASGEIILFLGDDILPASRDFLRSHMEAHEKSKEDTIFVGFTTWYPKLKITRYMRWLESSGVQFGYGGLVDGQEIDFWRFYTSNISLPAYLMKKEKFSKKFEGYGYEDMELGYRLNMKRGVPMRYLANASAWHWHILTEEQVLGRAAQTRRGAEVFEGLHPDVRTVPHGVKKLVLQIITLGFLPNLLGKIKPEWGYYLRYKKEFIK